IDRAMDASADRRTFTHQLLTMLNDRDDQDAGVVRAAYEKRGLVTTAVDLLALADVPAHVVRGIYLEDDRQHLEPQELLEVYIDNRWVMFNPANGQSGLPDNFFMWQRGGRSL